MQWIPLRNEVTNMDVLVCGYGLMGKKVSQAIREHETLNLVGVVSLEFDTPIEEHMYHSINECDEKVEAVIDFSHPNNLQEILEFGIKKGVPLILATTGYSAEDIEKITKASQVIPIFQSFNTSFGVSMMNRILKEVAKDFYEEGYDIEILEKHHNQKIDAPSGTAKLLYEVMKEDNDELVSVYDRSAQTHKRERNEVGIQAIRAGTIFGEHSVYFASHDEIIEIKHTALSKDVFVQGAISACLKMSEKDKGLYTLKNLY